MSGLDALRPLLDLPADGTVEVLAVHLDDWGRSLRLVCRTHVKTGDARPFALVFSDCRDMRWRIYAHHSGQTAALVDIVLGSGDHRKPAHLLTDAFGVSIVYGTYRVEWDG
jgi:hypothetical protein